MFGMEVSRGGGDHIPVGRVESSYFYFRVLGGRCECALVSELGWPRLVEEGLQREVRREARRQVRTEKGAEPYIRMFRVIKKVDKHVETPVPLSFWLGC